MRLLMVGTRASKLALAQTELVIEELRKFYPSTAFKLEIIETEGDRLSRESLPVIGGKGLFIKEIEQALLDKRIDLAVHSLKDMPTEQPGGLTLGAILERADPRDVLISRDGCELSNLVRRAHVGTGSPRRRAQLLAWRDDLEMTEIRGNVDTRIRKLDSGLYDAIVLAAAGVIRLELEERITEFIPTDVMLPAAGQGALAIEARAEDDEVLELISSIHNKKTAREVGAEREFLAALGGGCRAPIAALCQEVGGQLQLSGLIAQPNGSHIFRDQALGGLDEGQEMAQRLAQKLIAAGANEILREIDHGPAA